MFALFLFILFTVIRSLCHRHALGALHLLVRCKWCFDPNLLRILLSVFFWRIDSAFLFVMFAIRYFFSPHKTMHLIWMIEAHIWMSRFTQIQTLLIQYLCETACHHEKKKSTLVLNSIWWIFSYTIYDVCVFFFSVWGAAVIFALPIKSHRSQIERLPRKKK